VGGYTKPSPNQLFWISSHFLLADPRGLGTQSLPQSIALRLIAFLLLEVT